MISLELAKRFPELAERGPALRAVVPVELRGRNHDHPVHGVELYSGFFNVLPGFEAGGANPRHAGNAFHARSAVRKTLPPEVQKLFTEKCGPSQITILPCLLNENITPIGVYVPAGASLSFFVDEGVSARCTDDFRALIDSGHEPFLDYAHMGEKYKAGRVLDVYHIPGRGTCAAIDWLPWAEKEILSGQCCSFSPVFFASDDSRLDFLGLGENVGALLHRSMGTGLPRLRGSIQPVSRLEDFVFRASFFRRRMAEFERAGGGTPLDAETELKSRMPAYHTAFVRYAELEREFGHNFYLQTK